MKRLTPMLAIAVLCACSPPAPSPDPPAQEAVAYPPDEPVPPPVPVNASAGPSGQDAMTWMFDGSGRDGRQRLMYSATGNDEMAVNLQCAPGAEVVQILVVRTASPGRTPGPWPFVLSSGPATFTALGVVEGTEELYVTGEAPLTSAVLTRFRETGELTVGDPGEPATPVNAIDGIERAAIDGFFASCS